MIELIPFNVSWFEKCEEAPKLIAEYAAECAIEGLPAPSHRLDMYRQLEEADRLKCIGAFKDGYLIGFITILPSVLPHYGVPVGVVESFYVDWKHRKTGAGVRLKAEAEKVAEQHGCAGLLISCPVNSDLASLLENSKSYIETNRVFFRRLWK